MATTVTVKGQVTLPKKVREAAGIKPGDKVEVRATASGVYIEKQGATPDYKERLYVLSKRRLIRDKMTTDEFMKGIRGDPDLDPGLDPRLKRKRG